MAQICFSCGATLNRSGTIGRREECPKCRADLRVCKNCVFYDVKAYNECREPQADVIKEKDRSNFCDYFQLGQQAQGGDSTRVDLKAKAEALFKNFGKK